MRLTPEQIADILRHADACQPQECCGLIADGEYFRLRNARTELDAFAIDMRDFHALAKRHRVEAVCHSHVGLGPMASETDRASCERLDLPFVIVSWPAGDHAVIYPSGQRAPLVGRQWAWLTHDCFTLLRDAFEAYSGIAIQDYEREWNFWERGDDVIGRAVAGSGFVAMPRGTAPQHLDVMAMRIGNEARVPNHLGLFLAPDKLLHQLAGRLSVRDQYSGPLQRTTELHLRHERLMRRRA